MIAGATDPAAFFNFAVDWVWSSIILRAKSLIAADCELVKASFDIWISYSSRAATLFAKSCAGGATGDDVFCKPSSVSPAFIDGAVGELPTSALFARWTALGSLHARRANTEAA